MGGEKATFGAQHSAKYPFHLSNERYYLGLSTFLYYLGLSDSSL